MRDVWVFSTHPVHTPPPQIFLLLLLLLPSPEQFRLIGGMSVSKVSAPSHCGRNVFTTGITIIKRSVGQRITNGFW